MTVADPSDEVEAMLSRMDRPFKRGELLSVEAAVLDRVLRAFVRQKEALREADARLAAARVARNESDEEIDDWARSRERMHRRAQRAEGKVLRVAAVAREAVEGGLRVTPFVDRGMTVRFGKLVIKESER